MFSTEIVYAIMLIRILSDCETDGKGRCMLEGKELRRRTGIDNPLIKKVRMALSANGIIESKSLKYMLTEKAKTITLMNLMNIFHNECHWVIS